MFSEARRTLQINGEGPCSLSVPPCGLCPSSMCMAASSLDSFPSCLLPVCRLFPSLSTLCLPVELSPGSTMESGVLKVTTPRARDAKWQ